MKHSILIAAGLLLPALAQDSTTTDSFATTSTSASDSSTTDNGTPTSTVAQPITMTVAVAEGGWSYAPDVVQISPGNYVEFDFYPTNHSVIRAEYLYPCVPYEMTGIDKIGFYSGPQLVDAILANPPKWTLLINDSNPIFYYCGAPGSCIDRQMVGVINPNASVSLDVQKEYAANSSFSLLPGQPWPNEEDPFLTTATSTATAIQTTTATTTTSPTPTTASTSSVTPSATTTAELDGSHHTTLSGGAIAGVAIGGAAVVLAIGAFFFCGRRSRRRNKNGSAGPTNPPSYLSNSYGYNSPTNKHMSATSAPLMDAFGNPMPNLGMYGYRVNHQQGYPLPQMQQNPMANFAQSQSSPSHDIFGPLASPSQQLHERERLVGNVSGTEGPSARASSPSSMHAAPAASSVGGIQAFLQRQGRMSPQPGDAAQSQPPHNEQGLYEMSATGTAQRSQYVDTSHV